MIIATHGILASQLAGFDADAQAFFDRVTTAGGTLSATEKTAVNKLVLDMKSYSIWSKMKAIYPMVGASSAACAQNLKSSNFTGSFSSGWTFASTGVTPNGISAYMDTGFNTNTNQTVNNFSLSVYLRTASIAPSYSIDMGNMSPPSNLPLTALESIPSGRGQYAWDYNTASATIATTDSRGMWGVSRTDAGLWQSFERNTTVSKTTTSSWTSLPNSNVYLGASNSQGTASAFASRQIAFAHLADGITSAEFNSLYTAVQAFQTTLSRQV